MDVSQYLEIFIDETKEHLQTLSDQLMILEQEPENMETINEIFRAAHSLKGMAGTMGYKRMQRLTHDMENVFQEIRSGNMKVQPELVDVLFRGLDALEGYLANILDSADEGTEENQDIINALNDIVEKGTGKSSQPKPAVAAAQVPAADNAAGGALYESISISDYEINTFETAKEQNLNILGITVYLQETCILKAARAFLVFKALEVLGEVMKAVPDVQDIEDEKFDMNFSLIYFTQESAEKVKAAIENVSEIKEAVVGEFKLPEQEAAKAQEPAAKESKIVPGPKQAGAAAVQKDTKKETEKKPEKKSAKPAVGRTVRVDIEKLDVLMNLVSELIIAKNGLVSISSNTQNTRNDNSFNEQIEYLESVTTNLHESVMKVRMVPIEELAKNLEGPGMYHVYEELEPYVTTIRAQHEDIIRNANMRQEFTANVSHELKTPLTSISGYSELIENGIATGDDVQRFAREIHKSSNRLLTLINDIIRLSELDVTTEDIMEELDICDMAANCVEMLQMSAEKHQVQLSFSGEQQMVTANRQMMDELIYNLCDNAIRYNNPGGRVDVSVYREVERVVLEVKDNGIGIPEKDQERIFERFYRVDKSRSKSTGGTGLGLAIVKHIIALHDNVKLELRSKLGEGTTIYVYFTK